MLRRRWSAEPWRFRSDWFFGVVFRVEHRNRLNSTGLFQNNPGDQEREVLPEHDFLAVI